MEEIREGQADGDQPGWEIDFGRRNPCSSDQISLFENLGNTLPRVSESRPSGEPALPERPNSRNFPVFSLPIRDSVLAFHHSVSARGLGGDASLGHATSADSPQSETRGGRAAIRPLLSPWLS